MSDELADERITARHSIHRQDLRTGVCQHPGCAHSATESMGEQPSPGLPAWEQHVRALASGYPHVDRVSVQLSVEELDRLRLVQQAATALVEHLITEIPPDEDHRVGVQWNSKRNRLEFALVDAVRGETP